MTNGTMDVGKIPDITSHQQSLCLYINKHNTTNITIKFDMNAKYDNYQYTFIYFITYDHMYHHIPHVTNNQNLKIRTSLHVHHQT